MLADLHKTIAAICPIDGISIADRGGRTTWRIDFQAAATPAQRAAAQVVLASFDINAPSQDEMDVGVARIDAAIIALRSMTPAQARTWVGTNVNNLSDAKSLLATMAAVLCVLARRL